MNFQVCLHAYGIKIIIKGLLNFHTGKEIKHYAERNDWWFIHHYNIVKY